MRNSPSTTPTAMRRLVGFIFTGTLIVTGASTAVAQPAVAQTALEQSAASDPSPSVSPAVPASLFYGYMYDDCKTEGELCSWCPRGDSCGIVSDPNVWNLRRVFYFYHCRVHSVQNWRGWGSFVNNQTDNARTTLYGRNMNVLARVPADSRMHFYNLEPVWYVRTC